jgi:DNA-binding transcriptional LysR family regulator
VSKGHFFEMNTSDLRAFVYVIELGSFSRAAEALGVSQPTVSLRLRHLEERLGLKLLERRHGIALTPVGRSLYNRARHVLAQLERFERSAEDLARLRDGRLRVGISTPRFAMRLLGRFRNAHPAVSLELSLGNSDTLLDRLQRSEIDAAIMTLRAPPDGGAHLRIAEQSVVALLSCDDPLAARKAVDPRTLAEQPLLLRERGSMTRSLSEEMFEAEGVALRNFIEVPSREAMKEAVATGLGCGVLLSGEGGEDRRLVTRPLAGTPVAGGVYLCAEADTEMLPAVAALFDLARAVAAET